MGGGGKSLRRGFSQALFKEIELNGNSIGPFLAGRNRHAVPPTPPPQTADLLPFIYATRHHWIIL